MNMLVHDAEADAILAAGVRQEIERTSTTLDEVMRVHPRLPFDQAEFSYFREVVQSWQRNGRNVRPLPLDKDPAFMTDADLTEFVTGSAGLGLAYVSAVDLDVGLLIVKVDAGRGLFGRQRSLYACFMMREGGALHAVGTVKTLTLALTKLGALYRT